MTDISEPTISRYRTGKTVPSVESGYIERIAEALAKLPGGSSDKEEIYEDLLIAAYEDLELVDYAVYSEKLSTLINVLKINKSKLADDIPIGASSLSKICSGRIKPRNPVYIAESVARYVAINYPDLSDRQIVQGLIWENDVDACVFSSYEEYFRHLKKWLLTGKSVKSIIVENMLHRFREYELTDYLPYPKDAAALYPVDNASLVKNDFRLYTGLDGLEKAFFTWVDMACNSKVNDEIFMFDEVFAELARKDHNSTYKYIGAIERLIRSGKEVTFINNLQNDLYLAAKKMLVWLPLTMSKRVNNYFFNESKENLYRNMILISSDAALIGNTVANDYENGCYSLITSAPEILIAKQNAKAIKKRATLSNYVFTDREKYIDDLIDNLKKLDDDDTIYMFLPVPPLSTMKEELLKRILKRSDISQAAAENVLEKYHAECDIRDMIMKRHPMNVIIDRIDSAGWQKEPVYLALSDRESDLMIPYTYEEYMEHIESSKEYADMYESLQLSIEFMGFLKNMNVIYVPGKYGAVTTLNNLPVDTSSTNKIIVDSFAELINVMNPKNREEVLKDEKKKDLLNFIKNIMQY